MSQQLYIDAYGDLSGPLNWAIKSELGTAVYTGSMADVAEAMSEDETRTLTLVFSGLDVSLLSADMPTRNQQKITQALPFLFEEQLIDEPEDLHFAIGPLKSERLQVAVITKAKLREWLDALTAVGVTPDSAVVDTQLLNRQAGGWLVWCDETTALVSIDANNGFACDRDQLVELLMTQPFAANTREETDGNDSVETLRIDHHGELDLFPFTSNFPTLKVTDHNASPRFQYVVEQTKIQKNTVPIELLQLEFSAVKKTGLSNRLPAIAASVALLFVVGYSSLLWYQNSQLQTEQTQLQNAMVSLYKETFPNSKRVVDAKVQMQGHLKKIGSADDQKDGLLNYLKTLAEASPRNRNIEIKQLRFQKNSLELKFETESLQIVEQLRNKIHKKGLTTKVLSANKDSGRVKARLKIGAAS